LYLISNWICGIDIRGTQNILNYTGNIILSITAIVFLQTTASKIGSYYLSGFNFDDNSNKRISEQKKFEQQKVLVENSMSVNIPYVPLSHAPNDIHYLNITQPESSILIWGVMGMGKTYAFVLECLHQWIRKGFAGVVYDYKNGDLTDMVIKYHYKISQETNAKTSSLVVVNFAEPIRGYRINPLALNLLQSDEHCNNIVESLLKTLNRKWINERDFWADSTVSFVVAGAKFLRNTKLQKTDAEGKVYYKDCCSLSHLIALCTTSMSNYDTLYAMMNYEKSIPNLLSFLEPLKKNAHPQVAGMFSSIITEMGKLNSTRIMFLCSEFPNVELTLNDPANPQIVCLKYDNQIGAVYTPIASAMLSQAATLMNQKGRIPSFMANDEAGTIYVRGIDELIATGRANKVCTLQVFQDKEQMIRDYGKDVAPAMINIIGNKITLKCEGETAKHFSSFFGETEKAVEQFSVQEGGNTSVSISHVRKKIVEPYDLSKLGVGQFAASVIKDKDKKIKETTAIGDVIIDPKRDDINYPGELYPILDAEIKDYTEEQIKDLYEMNYKRIYQDIQDLIVQNSIAFQLKNLGNPEYPKTELVASM